MGPRHPRTPNEPGQSCLPPHPARTFYKMSTPLPRGACEQQGTIARKGSRGAEEENVAALLVGRTSSNFSF